MILPLFLIVLQVAPQRAPDRWFAEDKLKHFFASFVVTSLSASGARFVGLDARQSLAVGVGAGAAAGVLKEYQDVRGGGFASYRDLLWDAAGVGGAVLVLDAAR